MPDAIDNAETAFPAFIGYSEKADAAGEPVWIASLAQYRAAFGGAGRKAFASTKRCGSSTTMAATMRWSCRSGL